MDRPACESARARDFFIFFFQQTPVSFENPSLDVAAVWIRRFLFFMKSDVKKTSRKKLKNDGNLFPVEKVFSLKLALGRVIKFVKYWITTYSFWKTRISIWIAIRFKFSRHSGWNLLAVNLRTNAIRWHENTFRHFKPQKNQRNVYKSRCGARRRCEYCYWSL